MSAESFLTEKAKRTVQALETYLAAWEGIPDTLNQAIRYTLLADGKRLRPALALGAAEMIAGDDTPALPLACALEMIHTYSLIHDDLPCMDDDDIRRGKPTSHKVYGEAIAILAGDGLLTMAFELLAKADNSQVIAEVARAAGVAGMVGGQVADLQSERHHLDADDLKDVHRRKTGALIRASVRAGGLVAGANAAQLAILTAFGENIGFAFQIADDILDVTGDEAVLGKAVGSDHAKGKATYPALVGLEESQRLANNAAEAAIEVLASFGTEADSFRDLARYIVVRNR
jgi:geranylgeranyl diphosphate synthase type II